MVERSRSGAYIPVGMIHRSQLEATSPWCFLERAKRSHAEDVCPDCAAERDLKIQEAKRPPDATPLAGPQPQYPASTATVAATPAKLTPKAIETELPNNTGAIVVIRHEGTLDRVVTDPRRGPLTRDSTRRLSDNLVKVSKAVAELGSVDEHKVLVEENNVQPTVVKAEPPNQRSRSLTTDSMSDLLQSLHEIAGEMSIDLTKAVEEDARAETKRVSLSRQSLLLGEDADSLLTAPTTPVPLSETVTAAAPPSKSPQSPSSTYVTALSSRKHSLQSPTGLPSSILRAADYAPSSSTPASQQPVNRLAKSSSTNTVLRPPPGHFPLTPAPLSPWSIKSPEPVKHERVVDQWPPQQHSQLSSSLPTPYKGKQVVSRAELHEAVQEAAAIERSLRRRVKTHGGLNGAYKGQK